MGQPFPTPKALAPWSLLGSEKVFEAGDRMRVSRQVVQLPDHAVIDNYYQIDLPTYATIYAVTDKNEVLVLEQYKHGVGQVCLTLPGGQIEQGENAEFAARRELLEETGYGGGMWTAGPSLILHGNQRVAVGHVFVARHVMQLGEPASEDLEDMRLCLLGRETVRHSIMTGDMPITSHVAAVGIAEALLSSQ